MTQVCLLRFKLKTPWMFTLSIDFCWSSETEMTQKQETQGTSTHQSFLEDSKSIPVIVSGVLG